MTIKPRHALTGVAAITLGAALLGPTDAVAKEDVEGGSAAANAETSIPGFVYFEGTDEQPLGMKAKDIATFIDKDLEGEPRKQAGGFDSIWTGGKLFATPLHEVHVGPFLMGQFEVSNAQWRTFLDSPRNQYTLTTDVTFSSLAEIVRHAVGIDPDKDPPGFQRAWQVILERNRETLMPLLNPEEKEDFDPLVERAQLTSLKAGVEIAMFHIMPPPKENLDWDGAGNVKEHARKRPVHWVSWYEAQLFARWAGFHIPREREWAHAARGVEGRRFAWGDEWNEKALVWTKNKENGSTADVDTYGEFATPGTRIHHMSGNVCEWVHDIARIYPGSKTTFTHNKNAVLARGGQFASKAHELLAAERFFDAGDVFTVNAKTAGYGLRLAAYPNPAMDLTMPVALEFDDHDLLKGPWLWVPRGLGLSEKDATKKPKYLPLLGFGAARSGGVLKRNVRDGSGGTFTYVWGPAQGIAFLPVKGILNKALKSGSSLTDLAEKSKEGEYPLLIGILTATDNCTIRLYDEAGENPKEVSLSDGHFWGFHERLHYEYPIGALLVLRGDRVAVYPADPGTVGDRGAHLRGEPLGWLPTPYAQEWVSTKDASPSGSLGGGRAVLTAVVPQINGKGEVMKNGKSAVITIEVEPRFEDR